MAQTVVHTLFTEQIRDLPSNIPQQKTSEKVKASGYYYSNREIQTLTWSLSNNFTGSFVVQASLVSEPESDADWFDVFSHPNTGPKTGFHNLTGNHIWLRARIKDWLDGTVHLVTLSY